MKISREWLSEFIDFNDLPFLEVTDLITTRVAEIEEVYTVGTPCDKAIVVKVNKVEAHPKKDNLTVVEVTDGKTSYQVVCSAKNVKQDMLTAYIPVGGVVRKSSLLAEEEFLNKVESGEVHGVLSEGLLVSESELGVGPLHLGIMDFTGEDVIIGSSVSTLGYISDQIIDIDNKSLTHRPDLWCHFGFARELSAILKRPLKVDFDPLVYENELFNQPEIADYEFILSCKGDCRRVSFTGISNIAICPTPSWVRRRLYSIGAGTKSLLIDLSNYILHEVGQPNHAYDVRSLRSNKIFVRKAGESEPFTGLDGIPRILTTNDMVMADTQGPVDLAGVIGGAEFSIQDDTNSILLEAANFDPVLIRKTCKEHGVRTDSSVRFEKSLSPYQTVLAPLRFIELLRRIGADFQLTGYSDIFDEKPESLSVNYNPLYIQERLGGVPELEEIDAILSRLKFEKVGNALKVPFYRATRDISIEDDLVEEVGRTIGYERVPSVSPKISSSSSRRSELGNAELKIREVLSSEGFTEVYCYTFASKERTENLGYALDASIEVQNPVDKNLNIVQLTLVPNMLDVLNLNNKNSESFFGFEIGRAYCRLDDSPNGYRERRLCSISGIDNKKNDSTQTGGNSVSEGALFYGIRKSVERLIYNLCGKIPSYESYDLKKQIDGPFELKDWMHPYRAAKVLVDSQVVGVIGEIKPSLLEVKSSRAVISEIDIHAVRNNSDKELFFRGFSRFPKSSFEVSLVVDARLEYNSMEKVFIEAFHHEDCQTSLIPFSIYRGAPLSETEKSVSLRFTFALPDGTLSGEQIEHLQKKVLEVADKNNYQLRG